jgi:hypothetical protein
MTGSGELNREFPKTGDGKVLEFVGSFEVWENQRLVLEYHNFEHHPGSRRENQSPTDSLSPSRKGSWK